MHKNTNKQDPSLLISHIILTFRNILLTNSLGQVEKNQQYAATLHPQQLYIYNKISYIKHRSTALFIAIVATIVHAIAFPRKSDALGAASAREPHG